MSVRTDLAVEENMNLEGIETKEKEIGEIRVSKTVISSDETAKKINKPCGKYITVSFPDIEKITDYKQLEESILISLKSFVDGSADSLLVVGLGNREITADSIGPKTAERILATRHIAGEFAEKIGLKGLKSVAVIAPNVLGNTGIEAVEIIKGAVDKIKPRLVIVIDACVSRGIDRIFRTIQISNTGISPGSGVKNSRKEISESTLKTKVISIGIPTVVDAMVLAEELSDKADLRQTDLVLTPKDCDLYTHRVSEILARSLNKFLQPEISEEILFSLV